MSEQVYLRFTSDGFVILPDEYAAPQSGPFSVECPTCYQPAGNQCFDGDFGGPTGRICWDRWAASGTTPPPEVTW